MSGTFTATTTQATAPAGRSLSGCAVTSLRDGKRLRWYDTRRM